MKCLRIYATSAGQYQAKQHEDDSLLNQDVHLASTILLGAHLEDVTLFDADLRNADLYLALLVARTASPTTTRSPACDASRADDIFGDVR